MAQRCRLSSDFAVAVSRDGAASSMIEMALIFYKKFRSVPQALTLRTSGS